MTWKSVPIGSLGRVVTGKTPPSAEPECFGSAIPFLTPSDMSFNDRHVATERGISEIGNKRFARTILPKNAVSVVCIGATIGKICMTAAPTLTNQQINSIICDEKRADPLFVYYSLRLKRDELAAKAAGAATPIINKSAFERIEIELPALNIQRKVSDILSGFDDLIEVNWRRIATLEEMARRLFDEWSADHASPNWKVGTLGDLAEITGASMSPGATPDHVYAHFSLPTFDVTHLPVVEAGRAIMSNKLQFQHPAVLVSKLNPRIPRVWYVGSKPPATAICSTEFVPLQPKAPVGIGWLASLCLSTQFMGALRGLAQGTSTSHQRAKPTDILALPTRIPPRDFALQAERVLASNYDLCHVLRLTNSNLRAARDILLPKLISGEIDLEHAGRDTDKAIRRVAAA